MSFIIFLWTKLQRNIIVISILDVHNDIIWIQINNYKRNPRINSSKGKTEGQTVLRTTKRKEFIIEMFVYKSQPIIASPTIL